MADTQVLLMTALAGSAARSATEILPRIGAVHYFQVLRQDWLGLMDITAQKPPLSQRASGDIIIHIKQRASVWLIRGFTCKRFLRFVPLAVGWPSFMERYK